MVDSCYKVIERFEPLAEHQPREEYLCAEVGDILVECERVDDYWFRGKAVVRQKTGRIPQLCIHACSVPQNIRQDEAIGSEVNVDSLIARDSKSIGWESSKRISGALTENPLAVALDKCSSVRRSRCDGFSALTPLDKSLDKSRSAGALDSEFACLRTSSKEEHYVDMSSGESVNDCVAAASSSAVSTSDKDVAGVQGSGCAPVAVPSVPINPPKPRRGKQKFSSFRSGTSDEGYSGSLHSGETAEQQAPLLVSDKSVKSSCKQDEGGYEVPMLKLVDSHGHTLDRVEAGPRRKARGFFSKSSKYGVSEEKLSSVSSKSSSSNGNEEGGYYAPTAKLRDSYFIPSDDSSSLMLRMLVCFSAALLLSLAVSLVLRLVAHVQPVLCFSMGAILFLVTWVAPVMLLNRGFACVIALLAPSIFSTKVKVGIFVLLAIILLTGPVFGIIDKLSVTVSCKSLLQNVEQSSHVPVLDKNAIHIAAPLKLGKPTLNDSARFIEGATMQHLDAETAKDGTVNQICNSSFDRVLNFCSRVHERFVTICQAQSASYLSSERSLCLMPLEYFCGTKERVVSMCTVNLANSLPTLSPDGEGKSVSGDVPILRDFSPRTGSVVVHGSANGAMEGARTILLCLLPLLLLLVVHEAYSYNKDFQTTKDTDNVYITSQLKDIDSERNLRGLSDLIFPLTRLEFRTNLVRRSLYLSKHERLRLFWWLLAWAVSLLLCLLTIGLDVFVGKAVRVTNFTTCAIDYNKYESSRSVSAVYAILASMFLLILLQSYVLRLRSKICSAFYPKRESVRAMHLYYRILHDRAVFNRRCRRRVQILAEEKRMSQEASFKTRLYRCLPAFLCRLCDLLCVHRCMICLSWSYSRTVTCPDELCRARFCFECYVDSGQKCIGCYSSTNPTSAVATETI